MKHIIEVTHQFGIREYDIENFETAAMNTDGWIYNRYETIAEAAEDFGGEDEVPAELAEILKHGPAVEVIVYSDGNRYMPAEKFDAEREAENYIADDLSRLIVLETIEDGEYYANKYHDHEWPAVRAAAARWLDERFGLADKKRAVLADAFHMDPDEVDVEAAEADDTLTLNEGRDGRSYLWYLDSCDDHQRIMDVETGVFVDPDKAEELFG